MTWYSPEPGLDHYKGIPGPGLPGDHPRTCLHVGATTSPVWIKLETPLAVPMQWYGAVLIGENSLKVESFPNQ